MSGPADTTQPVAAIQMATQVGDAAHNIRLAESMAGQAADAGARIIALPEFFTSAIAPDDRAYAAVLGASNAAIDMLQRLARQRGVWIGGSMLLAEAGEVYNRYVFAEPDGQLHTHDKDLPTMWENAFYTVGRDPGVWQTKLGGVGAAVCWELIRTQTVARMRGQVGLAMTGTHWWTLPENWPGLGPRRGVMAALGRRNRALSSRAPAEFARRLGAPVVQASHCGPVTGRYRLVAGFDAGLPYRTHFVGATQIVAADGTVLAARPSEAGPGIVHHALTLGAHQPAVELDTQRFWIPDLPWLFRRYWDHQNWVGRSVYRRRGRDAGLAAARRNTQQETP